MNLAEEKWVNAVLEYAQPLYDEEAETLTEFIRQRYESGTNEMTSEAEFYAWVDAQVADYYG